MKIKNLLLSAILCSSMLSFSQADLPNNGISGPIHQKYMGKIVFALSGDAFAKGNEKELEFVTKATLGGEIYYRAYLDNSLTNYLKTTKDPGVNGRWKIKFYIDGKEAGVQLMHQDFFSGKQKQEFTTFKGALKSLPDGDFTGEVEFDKFFKKNISKFTIGDHVLKIEYMPYSTEPKEFEGPVVASGEITLTVKNDLTVNPNDENICLRKAEMNDKLLEAEIKKCYDAEGYPEKVVKVRITSPSWYVERNKVTGIIISRHIDAIIGYTTKDGDCAYKVLSFYQSHNGTGYKKDFYLMGLSKITYVNCGCFN